MQLPDHASKPRGATVDREWHNLGPITICPKMRPKFQTAPDEPGVYVLEFGGEAYVGHSENLSRRLTEYRNSTDSIGERYIRHRICIAGGGVAFYIKGQLLKDKSSRLKLERAVINELRSAGKCLLNKGVPSKLFLAFKIGQLEEILVATRKTYDAIVEEL